MGEGAEAGETDRALDVVIGSDDSGTTPRGRGPVYGGLAFILLIACLSVLAGIGAPRSVDASVWYTGYGRFTTVQIVYESQCMRTDLYSGVGPCYRAVWANSLAIGLWTDPDDVMWQESYGYYDDVYCVPYLGCYSTYTLFFYDPDVRYGTYYVSDYLVHLAPLYMGSNPVNAVGWTWHRNYTKLPNSYFYPESKQYCDGICPF